MKALYGLLIQDTADYKQVLAATADPSTYSSPHKAPTIPDLTPDQNTNSIPALESHPIWT